MMFFTELQEFSDRYVRKVFGLDSSKSPWGYDAYRYGAPSGAIIHFTADEDPNRVLKWFLKEKYGSKISAHAVVMRGRHDLHEKLSMGLPLVRNLPCTVIQCRPPEMPAWHATWQNPIAYGIENVNAGELRGVMGSYTSWGARIDLDGDGNLDPWTERWDYGAAVNLNGVSWATYTPDQIDTNAVILRHLQDKFESLSKDTILGHVNVQQNKVDPGLAFPLHIVRRMVFERDYDGKDFEQFKLDPRYMEFYRDGLVLDWVNKRGGNKVKDPKAAWSMFYNRISRRLSMPRRPALDLAMMLLGYTGYNGSSTTTFQRMSNLKQDGVIGPITRYAIVTRLRQLKILLS